jgi:hypothetical protein
MNKRPAIALIMLMLLSNVPCNAQSNQADLEKMMNHIDHPDMWKNVPNNAPRTVPLPQRAQPQRMQHMQQQQPVNKSRRRELTRIMMEGGAPSGGGGPRAMHMQQQPQQFSGGSNAYSQYQKAENEAKRAYNYAQTARTSNDKWIRKDSASKADYAARSARYASDAVYYAAQKGDPVAKQYQQRARYASDRARADAGRAASNANRY